MPRKATLSFELLRTFLKLVENGGNAAKTAKDLKINQPSMSKRLSYLQHRGPVLKRAPWLVREGKTWKLTEEGQNALPAAEEIVRRYQQLVSSTDKPAIDDPVLAFACGRHAVLGFVRDALRSFRRKHPDVRLQLSTLRGEARVAGVANGSLDLALVAYSDASIREIAKRDLHIETIAHEPIGLVCSRKAPWAKDLIKIPNKKLNWTSLTKFPLILPETDAGISKMIEGMIQQKRLSGKLDVRLRVGGWGTILDYVRDGHGVGLISQSAVPDSKDLVVRYFDSKVIPLSETKIICRYDIKTNEADLTPLAKDLYQELEEAAGK